MNDFVMNCANNEVLKVDVPNLAITPIPSLKIDKVDVSFDMKINDTVIKSNQNKDENV